MKILKTYKVTPKIPERIDRLRDLAGNLWWCWDHDSIALLRRIDPELWEETGHNPVAMLTLVGQDRLNRLGKDEGFIAHYQRVIGRFDSYMTAETWCSRCYGANPDIRVAYFSAEFGLTEGLPIYSGGLGILAGDHLKSASDLGIPLTGVGLLYQKGYFRQHLNYDGWQGERYETNDFSSLPVSEAIGADGKPVVVPVEMPGRTVRAKVWMVNVGRIKLYLLNTNIPDNYEPDRTLTDHLYGGDSETRIQQEMILGIGGYRALDALGLKPTVAHMNEGHSAFLGLERIRGLMSRRHLDFETALEISRAGTVFTTHTPVPAGIDRFPRDMVRKYLGSLVESIGLPFDRFMSMGAECCGGTPAELSMAALAFNLSGRYNGVSKLHGQVSRSIFKNIWNGLLEEEVPIGSVTNGVHHPTWISADMESLYLRYLGERWETHPEDQSIWEGIDAIPHEEIWRTHERRRERLVAFARTRLKKQLISRGAPASQIASAEEVLDPEILTIGFARRFATYKRADLILRNPERLAAIVNNSTRPVQIIFSGKAHPKDAPGKELIRELVQFTERPEFRKRLVFIEDYDMTVARYLVQGVDVWLNTPRRLYEASGTSGMKAAANGVLNMSILDGWWDEAYRPEVGWAIGKGEEYEDIAYQYDIEANAIYDLLEQEIVPLFYARGADRIPRGWTRKMKDSVRLICPVFNTNRMVYEYMDRYYAPAAKGNARLKEKDCLMAKTLADYRRKITGAWEKIRIEKVDLDDRHVMPIGDTAEVKVQVYLDGVEPTDVAVQLVEGQMSPDDRFRMARVWTLDEAKSSGTNRYTFSGEVTLNQSGLRAMAVRILPSHPLLEDPLTWKMVQWGE